MTTSHAQAEIIQVISTFVLEHPDAPLVWTIASRSESYIPNMFDDDEPRRSYWSEYIPVNSTEVCEDVERFLRPTFKMTHKKFRRSVLCDWPSDTYENYSCSFWFFRPCSSRHGIHVMLIQSQNRFVHLDTLYEEILSSIPPMSWQTTKQILCFAIYYGRIDIGSIAAKFTMSPRNDVYVLWLHSKCRLCKVGQMPIHDMPTAVAPAAHGQQPQPGPKRYCPAPAKTFQCRGYGECRMVFSRSKQCGISPHSTPPWPPPTNSPLSGAAADTTPSSNRRSCPSPSTSARAPARATTATTTPFYTPRVTTPFVAPASPFWFPGQSFLLFSSLGFSLPDRDACLRTSVSRPPTSGRPADPTSRSLPPLSEVISASLSVSAQHHLPLFQPDSLQVPYCQQVPKNAELDGLFHCQIEGSKFPDFSGDQTGNVPLGLNEVNPPGSCPANPDGPIPDGVQLNTIVDDPGVGNVGGGASSGGASAGGAVPSDASSDDGEASSGVNNGANGGAAGNGGTTGNTSGTGASSPAASGSAGAGGNSDFVLQNDQDAQSQNAEFANLTADLPCTDGENACVGSDFAQCVGGKFVTTPCSGDLICVALPLVNLPGTSVTCTAAADRDARIAATGA